MKMLNEIKYEQSPLKIREKYLSFADQLGKEAIQA